LLSATSTAVSSVPKKLDVDVTLSAFAGTVVGASVVGSVVGASVVGSSTIVLSTIVIVYLAPVFEE
jgi:uncharacterized membrane protein